MLFLLFTLWVKIGLFLHFLYEHVKKIPVCYHDYHEDAGII